MAVVVAMFASYSAYNAQNERELTGFALANIEALAKDETDNTGKTWQVGNKKETTEIYTTTSPGWSWSTELNIWLLDGQVTNTNPPEYKKETTTIEIKCCREQGDLKECSYEKC